jgi:hypothetical protein
VEYVQNPAEKGETEIYALPEFAESSAWEVVVARLVILQDVKNIIYGSQRLF